MVMSETLVRKIARLYPRSIIRVLGVATGKDRGIV